MQKSFQLNYKDKDFYNNEQFQLLFKDKFKKELNKVQLQLSNDIMQFQVFGKPFG
jgi:hypothetical protein